MFSKIKIGDYIHILQQRLHTFSIHIINQIRVMKDIPIGHATDNNHLYIIDELNHRLPVGASGELVITGPQVAKGYLNRPDKTNEVFVDNPFSNAKPFNIDAKGIKYLVL